MRAAERPATIIGGWAVFELVNDEIQRQSPDVDVLLHTMASFESFDEVLPSPGPVRDLDGKQKRMGCRRSDDSDKEILVDVFTPEPFNAFFKRHAAQNPRKPATFGLLPSVEFLLDDKISTGPRRQGRDAGLKKAKDLIDIRDLVLFNRAGTLPRQLLSATTKRGREWPRTKSPRPGKPRTGVHARAPGGSRLAELALAVGVPGARPHSGLDTCRPWPANAGIDPGPSLPRSGCASGRDETFGWRIPIQGRKVGAAVDPA